MFMVLLYGSASMVRLLSKDFVHTTAMICVFFWCVNAAREFGIVFFMSFWKRENITIYMEEKGVNERGKGAGMGEGGIIRK